MVLAAKLFERYQHLEIDPARVTWTDRINLRCLSQLGLVARRRA